MDQYAEKVALYPNPNADFYYIGYSNGTYCLAKALELYPCCRFKRVVFAGSVVRSSYDWSRFLPPVGTPDGVKEAFQVQDVLNYVATRDMVVACFPKLFETLHIPDLGAAGHDGFVKHLPMNAEFVKGGHAAALDEWNWDEIAEFIVMGKRVSQDGIDEKLWSCDQNPFVWFVGLIPPVVWAILVLLVSVGGWLIYSMLMSVCAPQWITTLTLVVYAWLLWAILTRL